MKKTLKNILLIVFVTILLVSCAGAFARLGDIGINTPGTSVIPGTSDTPNTDIPPVEDEPSIPDGPVEYPDVEISFERDHIIF